MLQPWTFLEDTILNEAYLQIAGDDDEYEVTDGDIKHIQSRIEEFRQMLLKMKVIPRSREDVKDRINTLKELEGGPTYSEFAMMKMEGKRTYTDSIQSLVEYWINDQ